MVWSRVLSASMVIIERDKGEGPSTVLAISGMA